MLRNTNPTASGLTTLGCWRDFFVVQTCGRSAAVRAPALPCYLVVMDYPAVCPICGAALAHYYGLNGLRGHLMQQHGRSGAESVDMVMWLLDEQKKG